MQRKENQIFMGEAKKQHYVPQFLLRNFASDTRKSRRIWVLDKSTGRVRHSSVRDVAHENRFYEYKGDGEVHVELEGLMQKTDSFGADIIRRIIQNRHLILSPDDRESLSLVIACQMTRTPFLRRNLRDIGKIIISKFGPDVMIEGDSKTIGEHGPEDDRLTSLLELREGAPEYAKILYEKVWLLNETSQRTPFIISDNPVARYNRIDRAPRGNLGLKNRGIEIHMPISPQFSLHLICPWLAERACATPSLMYKWTRALETGLPVALQPKDVEFANSLQVIWAERFVFSNDREGLELARDMLRTNPELKEGPGLR